MVPERIRNAAELKTLTSVYDQFMIFQSVDLCCCAGRRGLDTGSALVAEIDAIPCVWANLLPTNMADSRRSSATCMG